ncbi:DUF4128 domain-containing protein [Hyphomicrobium sp. DY-1]|uniref:DUF4128 domain-containing protein n=1 Tax=Hyphomicrobium sp. DY-1 TaxID=3075650 RepID=UPI0039C44F68
MAMAVEAKIRDALLAHLAALSLTPPLPVAYPDISFAPPEGTYLKAQLIPNTNRNQFVSDDSTTEFRGIFQITVVSPSGAGSIAGAEIAGKVADHFERGASLASGDLVVRIDGRPSVAADMQSTDRVETPISVSWYAFG